MIWRWPKGYLINTLSADGWRPLLCAPGQVFERDIFLGGIGTPAKILKRRKDFIIVPMAWDEKLTGCAGHVYKIALRVLYLHWKNRRWRSG
jgi:hypothetical protein